MTDEQDPQALAQAFVDSIYGKFEDHGFIREELPELQQKRLDDLVKEVAKMIVDSNYDGYQRALRDYRNGLQT